MQIAPMRLLSPHSSEDKATLRNQNHEELSGLIGDLGVFSLVSNEKERL
jgi:hypothetical protein